VVCDDTRESDLALGSVQTETKRLSKSALDHLEGDVFRPVRSTQVSMDCLRVQLFWSGRDYVRSALILLDAHVKHSCASFNTEAPASCDDFLVAVRTYTLSTQAENAPLRRLGMEVHELL
jgi:hypothetical protein